MGQGRQVRSLIRCLLLILSSIQGITPDARDLASPLALTLLSPFPPGHDDLDDDDAPDEICEAALQPRSWQDCELDSANQSATIETAGVPVRSECWKMILGLGRSDPVSRARDLRLNLCRLRC
jgi:hypothetical protein